MNKKNNLIILLLTNTIPLLGFWFFNWSMFAIIYIYWAEGFIVAFYSSVKIALARAPEETEPKAKNFYVRMLSSLKFLIFRIGILMFYWIFIFVFVAFPTGGVPAEVATQNHAIMWFKDSMFNNILLIYFLSQLTEFISTFIATDDYKNNPSSKYKIIFDSRTIVLHIVIVLGTFGYQFFRKYEFIHNKLPALSYVLLLVLIKSLSDIIQYRLSRNFKFKNN